MNTTIARTQRPKLPNGWKWVKLGDVCTLNPKRPQLDYSYDAPTIFLPMASVDAKTGSITVAEKKRFFEVSKGYTYIEEGDVLFAKITPSMQNGKHAVAHNLMNGFAFGSTEFHILRPTKKVIADWIHQFLRQKSILVEAKSHFRGTAGQQRVPASFLNELSIPLPPLAEQKQIAARLNEQMAIATEARNAAEEQLGAAKALTHAYLREVLPLNEDDLPDGWEWVQLGEVCEEQKKTIKSNSLNSNPLPYLGLEHIQSNTGTILLSHQDVPNENVLSNTFYFDDSHILYGKLRPYLNKVARPSFPGKCTTELIPLKPTVINRDFLWWTLKRPETVYYAMMGKTGTRMPRANMRELMKMNIPFPPISEQKRIAAKLNEQMKYTTELTESIEQELNVIKALPASLLKKSLVGEL